MNSKFLLCVIASVFVITSINVASAAEDNSIKVPFAEIKPTIDGKFTSETEWNNAHVTNFNSNGHDFYLLAQQDKNFVYLMLDGIDFQIDPKITDLSVRYQAILCFDGDNNKGTKRESGDFCHAFTSFNEFGREVRGEYTPIKFDSEGKSSHLDILRGLEKWNYGSQNDPFEESDHLMYEVRIPRTLFESLGDVGFTFEMYAGNSTTDVVQLVDGVIWPPESNKKEPSTWGELLLPQIQCRDLLELVFKSSDNSPVCVKPLTVEKLIQRGWLTSPILR